MCSSQLLQDSETWLYVPCGADPLRREKLTRVVRSPWRHLCDLFRADRQGAKHDASPDLSAWQPGQENRHGVLRGCGAL